MANTIHHLWSLGLVRSTEEQQQKDEKIVHSSYESLWTEYFRDPFQWHDNRNSKVGPAFPDFKHKITKECLWVDDCYTPSWVSEELRRRGGTHDRITPANNEKIIYDNTGFRNDECPGFVALLRACAKNKDLCRGIGVHGDIVKCGLDDKCSDALVTMYAKCGALEEAKELLDAHKSRDIFSWTAIIAGFTEHGQGWDALNCFEQMRREGLPPDAVTYTCILKACGSIRAADKGKQIHEEISRQGFLRSNIVLGTALVDMYAKCGSLAKAHRVLEELPSRDVIAWSALIAGYAQEGQGVQALRCFEQMQREGFSPNAVTFTCILKACSSIGAADMGEQIHAEIAGQRLLENNIVLGTALVDMYAKCGALTKAQTVLEELPFRNVNAWTALIAGYAQHGQGQDALNCFDRMQHEGIFPDAMTFACVLKACGSIGAVDRGVQIHDEIIRQGLLGNDIGLGTALMDMYVKCDDLAKAQQVLDGLRCRDVIPWNALLAEYAQRGLGAQALNCFEWMQSKGVSPDAVTLSCVLRACSHLGLEDDGQMYFVTMSTKYGVKPNLEHYACMVDLFGRARHLDKAVGVIQVMSSDDYPAIWSALLEACWKWGDVAVGRWAFGHAVQVDKSDAAVYIIMASVYAAAGMQEDAANIEAMRIESKAWKKPSHTS